MKHIGAGSVCRTGSPGAVLPAPGCAGSGGGGLSVGFAGAAEARGDQPGGGRVGTWHGDKHRLPVVAQLLDAFGDVGQRAVTAREIAARYTEPGAADGEAGS